VTQKKNTKHNKKGRHFVFWVGTNLLLFVTARLAIMAVTSETAIMTLLLLLICLPLRGMVNNREHTATQRIDTTNFGF
jgi:hypothetical protein